MYKISHDPSLKAPDEGGHNDFPPGWREITDKEFAQGRFRLGVPYAMEYRQMYEKVDGKIQWNKAYVGALLFWMPDKTGYAIVEDYWKGTVTWFAFGCDHKYHELDQQTCRDRGIYHAGRCYHVSECSLCHHINAVDSSD